jgi:DNA-binding GntR family transcriptional regulator
LRPPEPAWKPQGRAPRGVNFKSHIPLYIQLTEILKERIESGEWEPGQRFASEGEIGSEFGVSRTVVRSALAILESDGQLVKIKGRGIFVAPAKVVYRFDGLVRCLAEADPLRVRCRIIDATEEEVNERLAQALDLPVNHGRVTHIMSVAEVDKQPIGIRDSYVSPLVRDALLAYLASGDPPGSLRLPNGLAMHTSELEVEVSSATPFESEELGISPGAPTVLGTYRDLGMHSTAAVVPIEFARLVYRADITSFRLLI